jgi:hypothetical protein
MHRSTRGPGVARAPVALLALVVLGALIVTACEGGRQSPTPASPDASRASPASSPRLPTPVPTPLGPSLDPSPEASPVVTTGRLLLRFTTCGHTCAATPGTTFLDDGRLLWEAIDGSGQVMEARLSDEGIATARAAIEATPALAADGDYRATLRPGAEPIPHGLSSFRFDVEWAAGPVLVTAWDPASLQDQVEQWIFPPEMAQLARLAARLADPVAWLGEDAFEELPTPYSPTGALVRIDLLPDIGDTEGVADVDAVEWPFGQPIETAGEAMEAEELPAPRCVLLDEAGVLELRSAESAAGAKRDARLWETTIEYGWERADGLVHVTVRHLLPYQTGTCSELFAAEP